MNDIKKAFEDHYSPDQTKTYVMQQIHERHIPYKPVILAVSCVVVCMFLYNFFPLSQFEPSTSTASGEIYSETATDSSYADTTSSTSQKISYSSSLTFETEDIKETKEKLETLIDQYDGNITSSDAFTYNQITSMDYCIEIPADSFQAFLDEAENIATITNISTRQEDVTDQYIDLNARLNNLKKEEAAVQQLLDQTENISDVIAIQEQLTSIQTDIESVESEIQYYDSLTEYASIDIHIDQFTSDSLTQKIQDAFSNTFSSFLNVLSNIVIAIIYAFPYVLVIACIILIIHFFRKKRR